MIHAILLQAIVFLVVSRYMAEDFRSLGSRAQHHSGSPTFVSTPVIQMTDLSSIMETDGGIQSRGVENLPHVIITFQDETTIYSYKL